MLALMAEFMQAFCGDVHLGVAGNVNVTVGPMGRDASATVTVGKRGCAMVYSYSCSRGAFLGASIDGTVTHTRSNANLAFYGRPLTAKDLLLGGLVEAPPAARTLYAALDTMMNSFGYSQLPRHAVALQHAAGAGQPMRLPLTSTFSVDDFADEKQTMFLRHCSAASSYRVQTLHRRLSSCQCLMRSQSARQHRPAFLTLRQRCQMRCHTRYLMTEVACTCAEITAAACCLAHAVP